LPKLHIDSSAQATDLEEFMLRCSATACGR